jgi:radical SAM protein with 4Fe4S-binding SPASM domain
MQTPWKQRLKSWIIPQVGGVGALEEKIAPGLYHYQLLRDDGYMRFHLRVENSGESLLIAGASEAVRISQAGTPVLQRLLQGESPESVAGELPADAEPWIAQGVQIMQELGSPSSRFPVFNLKDPVNDSRDAELIAPFQADVEVDGTGQLQSILRQLWDAGIPHARFLPTGQVSDQQLVQAVEWAEDLGMIAGLRSTAGWLIEADRLSRLAAVGVDYLLTPWAAEPDLHRRWFGESDFGSLTETIRRAEALEVTPVIEIPLVESTVEALEEHWTKLVEWQVSHVEVYALAWSDSNQRESKDQASSDTGATEPLEAIRLRQLAARIEEAADEHAFQVTWLPPVGMSRSENIAEQARRGPRAGGDVAIRVLPNGDVLPPRGVRRPAGNLLGDPWEQIWGSALFRRFRERVEANTRCEQCPGLAICAADCPADPQGWSHE